MRQIKDTLVFLLVIGAIAGITFLANYLEDSRTDKTVTVLIPPQDWHPEFRQPHKEKP